MNQKIIELLEKPLGFKPEDAVNWREGESDIEDLAEDWPLIK